MKVLLINQYFHPDLSATAQLATDLAEDLAVAGHQVTALASRGAYLGGQVLPAEEHHRGVRIVRVASTSLGKGSIPRRLLDYGTFAASATRALLALPRQDVVVAMSTPPMVATLGALARRLGRGRFVYWVQDVYPDLAVAFGLLRPGAPTAWALDRLASATLRSADAVVAIGEVMAERLCAKGAAPGRLAVLPNWADAEAVRPVAREANPFRAAHGLEGRSVILYSGNMGRAHDLGTLLGAARRLAGRPDLAFVFVGDGARRPEVAAAAADLPAVRLLDYQPREQLSASLSAADVHVVTQTPETLGLVEPSKLYGVMAAGRPVLFIGPSSGEVARTVVREGLGEVVANGDVAGAATALERLLAEGAAAGARGRRALETTYGRPQRTAAFEALLRRVADGMPVTAPATP